MESENQMQFNHNYTFLILFKLYYKTINCIIIQSNNGLNFFKNNANLQNLVIA